MVKLEREDNEILNKKTDLGLVLTPPKTAEYIISRLAPFSKEEKVLDPCAGPGIFVKALLNTGVEKKHIHAYDINPVYKELYHEMGINFEVKDYLLSYSPFQANQFDVILGNPPYLNKASSYIRKNRKNLRKIYGKINAHETYSMFIVSSIWRLKNRGRLGFITSDSFLTLKTHEKLRKFLLSHCKIKEILLAPKNLFNNQNVNTNAVILILEKCGGNEYSKERLENIMNIVSRINTEGEYYNPIKIHKFPQKRYHLLPFHIFFIDLEIGVLDLFEKSHKLKDFIQGYIGMHTHDNLKYIAAVEGTELANIFKKKNAKIFNANKEYKIISRELLETKEWKPYLKRGGGDQYYKPIMEALDWNPTSVSIYDIPNNVPFEREGIIISGVSSRLAARYMPKGCYWDSNKAIGCIIKDDSFSIKYALGLLNSSLYNYLMKGIINNTNSIQLTGLHALPIIKPDTAIKLSIEELVAEIIQGLRNDLNYDYTPQQKQIDDIIFKYYLEKFNLSENLKKVLDKEFSIYSK